MKFGGESSKVPTRLERIELRLAQLEDGGSNHLAITLTSLADDLRNVVSRIEAVAGELDSHLRGAIIPAVPQSAVRAADADAPLSRRVSYRRILAENWLQRGRRRFARVTVTPTP